MNNHIENIHQIYTESSCKVETPQIKKVISYIINIIKKYYRQ